MKFIFTLLLLKLITLLNYCNSNYIDTRDFDRMEGIQVYHFKNENYYIFSSLNLKSDSTEPNDNNYNRLEGMLYIFMSNSTEIPKNGLWVSIGLGTPKMDGSDMIMCTYINGVHGVHNCYDYFSNGHTPSPDKELGGSNDVKLIMGSKRFNIPEEEDFAPYDKMISWSFSKVINKDDKYDWDKLDTLLTNQGSIIAAFGDISNAGNINFHKGYTHGKIRDGWGIHHFEDENLTGDNIEEEDEFGGKGGIKGSEKKNFEDIEGDSVKPVFNENGERVDL